MTLSEKKARRFTWFLSFKLWIVNLLLNRTVFTTFNEKIEILKNLLT